ncbi:MAG: ABC transporter ATP-binding protein [Fibrobacterota bacterium]
MALLKINNLRTYFQTDECLVKAVDGIDLSLEKGETLALVGESGCGKSVTALSILSLISRPPGRYFSGEILFGGKDLLKLSEKQMRKIRGNDISMIFQDPMTSLNPVYNCGDQVAEAVALHQGKSKKESLKIALSMFRDVGIPDPEQRLEEYPHQMSGGMRQRVMIAMALACRPSLLIADEPTTALDVTVQAQILELISGLRQEYGMSLLLITHDLGIVAETADRVAVMYAGQIVEEADSGKLFSDPRHPYTKGLLKSIPSLKGERRKLTPIKGNVPHPSKFPDGCRFHPRCPEAVEKCSTEKPPRKNGALCFFA